MAGRRGGTRRTKKCSETGDDRDHQSQAERPPGFVSHARYRTHGAPKSPLVAELVIPPRSLAEPVRNSNSVTVEATWAQVVDAHLMLTDEGTTLDSDGADRA